MQQTRVGESGKNERDKMRRGGEGESGGLLYYALSQTSSRIVDSIRNKSTTVNRRRRRRRPSFQRNRGEKMKIPSVWNW